jgi:hypothetical protein
MPGFNGTGPWGMGPMTGGGRGFCAVPIRRTWPMSAGRGLASPYNTPYTTPYYRPIPFSPETARGEELEYLKGMAQSIREDLKEIETRIGEIENKTD